LEAWPDMTASMFKQSGYWRYYVAAFICVANMALLNVVTGVVCEQVIEVARRMPPSDVNKHEDKMTKLRKKLKQRIGRYASHGDHTLDQGDVFVLMKSDEIRELLHENDIALPLERHQLALLLQIDHKRRISVDDLVQGILRMRGTETNRLSQALQYDILKSHKEAIRVTAECERKIQHDMRDSIVETEKRVAQYSKGIASVVTSLREARIPPSRRDIDGRTREDQEAMELADACAQIEAMTQTLDAAIARTNSMLREPRPLARAVRAVPPQPAPLGQAPMPGRQRKHTVSTQTPGRPIDTARGRSTTVASTQTEMLPRVSASELRPLSPSYSQVSPKTPLKVDNLDGHQRTPTPRMTQTGIQEGALLVGRPVWEERDSGPSRAPSPSMQRRRDDERSGKEDGVDSMINVPLLANGVPATNAPRPTPQDRRGNELKLLNRLKVRHLDDSTRVVNNEAPTPPRTVPSPAGENHDAPQGPAAMGRQHRLLAGTGSLQSRRRAPAPLLANSASYAKPRLDGAPQRAST